MLRNVMTHADLTVYPEIAMLIFVGVFALIAVRVMKRSRRDDDHLSALPLSED